MGTKELQVHCNAISFHVSLIYIYIYIGQVIRSLATHAMPGRSKDCSSGGWETWGWFR